MIFFHPFSSRVVSKSLNTLEKSTFGVFISDISWLSFLSKLRYKKKWYGRDFFLVDTFFPSSKICSSCDHKNKEFCLSQRRWVCSNCSIGHDRDKNAALNSKKEGLNVLKCIVGHAGLYKPMELVQDLMIDVVRLPAMNQEL